MMMYQYMKPVKAQLIFLGLIYGIVAVFTVLTLQYAHQDFYLLLTQIFEILFSKAIMEIFKFLFSGTGH